MLTALAFFMGLTFAGLVRTWSLSRRVLRIWIAGARYFYVGAAQSSVLDKSAIFRVQFTQLFVSRGLNEPEARDDAPAQSTYNEGTEVPAISELALLTALPMYAVDNPYELRTCFYKTCISRQSWGWTKLIIPFDGDPVVLLFWAGKRK